MSEKMELNKNNDIIHDNIADRDKITGKELNSNIPFANGAQAMSKKQERIFSKVDKTFAIIIFFVACLGIRAFPFLAPARSLGLGVTVYTVCYLIALYAYAMKKEVKINIESKFLTIIAILLSLSYTFVYNSAMNAFISLFLRFILMYIVLDIFSSLLGGKTGEFIIYDIINLYLIIPTCNLLECFVQMFSKKDTGKRTKIFAHVILGLIIALPVLLVVFVLLSGADIGFERLFTRIFTRDVIIFFREALLTIIFALFPASYMYGLMYGCANKRKINEIKREELENLHRNLKRLPVVSISVMMLLLVLVYAIFILLQGSYFFNIGVLPEEFTYSAYARKGFFELLVVALINILVVTATRLVVKDANKSKLIKVMNILLSVMTILLISNALMRMYMYVSMYGLTILRVVPSIFMLFLITVFILIIIAQFRNLELIRLSMYVFCIIFSIFSLVNVYEIMANYNLGNEVAKNGRITEKTLENIKYYDESDIHFVPALYSEWKKTEDEEYKKELYKVISVLYSEYLFEINYSPVDKWFSTGVKKHKYYKMMNEIDMTGRDLYDDYELYNGYKNSYDNYDIENDYDWENDDLNNNDLYYDYDKDSSYDLNDNDKIE